MARIEILIHPTCATSYKVLKHLAQRNLVDRVEVAPTSAPGAPMAAKAWSVPWIIVDGDPAATDPVSPEEVEDIILHGKAREIDDPNTAFMETVLHSAYAASLVILHDSLKPVIDEDLIKAALRTPLGGPDPGQARLEDSLYHEWKDKLARALAISLVREIWWASGGAPPSLEELGDPKVLAGSWLMAKASIGRVGLPSNPTAAGSDGVDRIADFLSKTYKSLVRRVEKEQKMILEDRDYWRLIKELGLD